MTGDRSPVDRIGGMLLRQARRRRAPGWVLRVLAGDAEPASVREEGDTRLVLEHEDGGRVEVEVRVHLPTPPAVGEEPWKPAGVDLPDEELWQLAYIVVDEIVEGTADLSVSPWPAVDDRGRLVFANEPARSVQADVAALSKYFQRIEFRPGKPPDDLRMGVAFAARVRTGQLETAGGVRRPPSAWLVPPVYDIRSPARDKAKEAFYAAVAPTLSEREAERIEGSEPRT